MPGVAGQAMRNAAEMALAEFNAPEHPASGEGRRRHRRTARRPAPSRRSTRAPRSSSGRCSPNRSASSARWRAPRNMPVIAFSTDANVAAPGVYLLSFLPETDVERIVAIRRLDRETLVRRAGARQPLWHGGGSGVQAGRRRAAAARSSRSSTIRTTRPRWPAPVRARRPGGGSRRRAVHSGWRRRGAGCGADAGRQRRQRQANPTARHRAVGRSAHLRRRRRSTAAGTRRPMPPASAASRRATAPATTRIRCAPRRSPMTRSRWSPRW